MTPIEPIDPDPEDTGAPGRMDPPRWWRRQMESAPAVGPRSLRLLILHWDDYPTAKGVYLEEFPQRGHQVTWVLRGEPGSQTIEEHPREGVRVVHHPYGAREAGGRSVWRIPLNRISRFRSFLAKWWWVWKETEGDRYDIVQARDLLPEAFIAWSVGTLRGITFCFQLDFMHFEGMLHVLDTKGIRSRVRRLEWETSRKVRDFLLKRAARLFVISETMRELYLEKGFAADRISVFPVGVGERFRAARPHRGRVRSQLGVSDEFVVAYVGNLAFSRDARLIGDCLKEICRDRMDIRFLILSSNAEQFLEHSENQELKKRCVFAGPVAHEDVPSYLAAADLGLYPIQVHVPYRLHETMSPLKVAEYMAVGLPVVSAAIPEAVELLEKSGGGKVVGHDPREYAEAVVVLAKDRDEAKAVGERGHAYIYRYKSFNHLADAVLRAYADTLCSRSR